MDPEQTARELIRALRGSRSQVAFSRRLGYRTNVAYAWESGRRWPTAMETLGAASRVGIDVRGAFERFYRTAPGWLLEHEPSEAGFVGRFLRDQRGETPIVTIAERAGVNRFSAARWLSGEVEPRLPDFLRMVEAASLRAVDLLASLVDPISLPSIRSEWERREAQRTAAIEEPWTQAVLRMLEVGLSDAPAISRGLSVDLETIQRCLDALARAGQARRIRGRWRLLEVSAVDTRRTPETARRLKSFWAEVGSQRLREGREGAFAYNVFAVSEDQLKRLVELHNGYYQAIRALIAEDERPECVALVNLQLVRLDR